MNAKHKVRLSLFILVTLIVSFLVVQSGASPTLTADEVIQIALADPEVSDWVNETGALPMEPKYLEDDFIWSVIFLTNSTDSSQYGLEVIIDDASGKVIDKYYFASSSPIYYEEVVEEALIYLQSQANFTEFFAKIPTESWWGYSAEGIVYLYGEYYYSDTYDFAQVALEFQENETGFEFTELLIQANFAWGSPLHSFEDVTSIVMSHEEVQEFVTLYGNYTLDVVETYYTGNASDEMYAYQDIPVGYSYTFRFYSTYDYLYLTEDKQFDKISLDDSREFCYCNGYEWGWLLVVVEDSTGTITQIAGTTTNQLSKEEVLDIVSQHSEFEEWLASLEDYGMYAYFDGYDTWYVDIYSHDSMDWGYAQVNDSSGLIVDYYIFIPIPATKTEAQVIDLFLESTDMKEWLETVTDYDVYTYYDGQGEWWVYAYDVHIYQNYAYASIDDVSGNILDIYTHTVKPPQMTLEEVYSLLQEPRFEEFLEKYPDSLVMAYYYVDEYYDDYYRDENGSISEPGFGYQEKGHWYVYVYSPTIVEAYIYLVIDDETATIIEEYTNEPAKLPQLDLDQVQAIISADEVYQNFSISYEELYSYIYYYDGMWYGWYEGRDDDGFYYYFSIVINDSTQEVVEHVISASFWYAAEDMESSEVYAARADQGAQYQQYPKPEGMPLSEVLEQEDEVTPFPFLNGFILPIGLSALATIVLLKRRRMIS